MAVGYAKITIDELSLIVGVTGHRDIAAADEAPLRSAFGGVLRELAAECPHTPLVVLSGLAAGADSLAAEEALAQNIPLIACLPMPVAEYERDFSPDELTRFRSLLAACARVTVTSPQREHGYVATGLYIVQYSHVLVAFWDGTESRGKGGTADVVDTRLTGKVKPSEGTASIPYLPELGPVYEIVTPRLSGPRPANAYGVKHLYPKRYRGDTTSESDFHAILGRMDLYNSDLAQTPASASAGQPLEDLMQRTDAAANRLQTLTNVFQLILFSFAFVGAAFQIVPGISADVKVVGLLLAFVAYWIARKYDYENRYQDYRALAEGLRVQDAWYCAGLTHHFADRAYLRIQEGELQWIRMALRSIYLTVCAEHECPNASPNHPNTVQWVRSQWRYYFKASRREYAKGRFLARASAIAFGVGLALTILSTLVYLPKVHIGWWAVPSGLAGIILGATLTVPLAMAAMFSALLSHYVERRSIDTNARRYERMFRVFDKARRELLVERGNLHESREILLALGSAALIEHADWLIMRRDRPLKVVSV
jgi:hypothetical protein